MQWQGRKLHGATGSIYEKQRKVKSNYGIRQSTTEKHLQAGCSYLLI